MNNYIPINKAVNPVCIYQGDEPLISKTLGVDEMIYGFDGTPSDYATCTGAPEMFIKVERDGLYYFGVEADDTGSLTIAGIADEAWNCITTPIIPRIFVTACKG